MSFPRYPKYKSSGVEWLGEVPDGWEAKPLKYSTLVYTGNSLNETEKKLYESTDPEALPYISSKDIDLETHEVQYENGLRIPKGQCGLKVAPSGSFLLCVEGGSAGRKVALLRHDVCFVNKLCCFSSRQNNKFRFYFSQSQNFKDKFGLSLTGLIGGVSTSLLKNFQIPTPSDSEQTAIAEFLDRETGKIDRLVAEQRRLMELLKEKRQAVISHAVTKGLNPQAPMKPSGIEWLGDVPAGWEVQRVKFAAKMDSGHTPSRSVPEYWENCTIPWVSLNDTKTLKVNDYIEETAIEISELGMANSSAHLIPEGSVVFTRDATIGLTAILMRPMAVSQHIITWTPNPAKLTSEFLLRVFRAMEQYLDSFTMGSTIKTIGMPDVRKLTFALPPIEEQLEICAHLKTELAKFDTLTAEAQRTIDLLQERRTALISAAVTGQIDVRQQPKN